MVRLGSMAMAQEARRAELRPKLRRGQYPARISYDSYADAWSQRMGQGHENDVVRKGTNLGANADVAAGENGEGKEMNMAAMIMEGLYYGITWEALSIPAVTPMTPLEAESIRTGCSLALTSPRPLRPRRACIPVAPRRHTVDNNPELPSYAAWPKGVAEDQRIVILIMGVPFIIDHCNADSTTMHIMMTNWTTVVHPVEVETELGDYVRKKVYDAGQMNLSINHVECQRDQRHGTFPLPRRGRGPACSRTRRSTRSG